VIGAARTDLFLRANIGPAPGLWRSRLDSLDRGLRRDPCGLESSDGFMRNALWRFYVDWL